MQLNELPRWVVPAAYGAVAFGVGTAVGYAVSNRKHAAAAKKESRPTVDANQLTFDFTRQTNRLEYTANVLQQVGTEMRDYVGEARRRASRDNHPSVAKPDEDAVILDEEAVKEQEREAEVVHIFANVNNDPNWNYEVECSQRDPDKPYVIHRDEFFNDEFGFNQRTFTYYAGDQVLADERDLAVPNHVERIGELKFGHGSGDPSLVYIRNEKYKEEYEIVHDDSAYQVTVLGEEIEEDTELDEIRHSRGLRHFRVE